MSGRAADQNQPNVPVQIDARLVPLRGGEHDRVFLAQIRGRPGFAGSHPQTLPLERLHGPEEVFPRHENVEIRDGAQTRRGVHRGPQGESLEDQGANRGLGEPAKNPFRRLGHGPALQVGKGPMVGIALDPGIVRNETLEVRHQQRGDPGDPAVLRSGGTREFLPGL